MTNTTTHDRNSTSATRQPDVDAGQPIFAIENLSVSVPGDGALVPVISDVSLKVHRGECLGVVGESGCGKTITFLAALGLLPRSVAVHGSVKLGDREMLGLGEAELEPIRGRQIGMISQDPQSGLNPVRTIGRQLTEPLRLHMKMSKRQAYARATDLLSLVGIPAPHERMKAYAHEISGGMCQRIMIAIALASEPAVLIADEPTTALDATVQLQVLDLLRSIQQQTNLSIVFITHDLGVVAEICDQLTVMYAGRSVETQPIPHAFDEPMHPYTGALLRCLPSLEFDGATPHYIPGEVPMPGHAPSGCPFHTRCDNAQEICSRQMPDMVELAAPKRQIWCHFPLNLNDGKGK